MSDSDQLAERVARTLWAREGTGPAWEISIEAVRVGFARIAMRVRADMLNGHGIVHGGMVFALADTAFAYACNSCNETTVAQNASIAFLAPAQLGDMLIAEASEAARVGRTGVYRVSVSTPDGRAIAEFTGASRTIGGAVVPDAPETPNN